MPTVSTMIAPTRVSNAGPGRATFRTIPVIIPVIMSLFSPFPRLPLAHKDKDNICDDDDNDDNDVNASEHDGATDINDDVAVVTIMMFGLGMSDTDVGAHADDDGSDKDVFLNDDDTRNDDIDDDNKNDVENASEQHDGATDVTDDNTIANVMMFGSGMSVTDVGIDIEDDISDDNDDDYENNKNAGEQHDGATDITAANTITYVMMLFTTDFGADNNDNGSDADVFCVEDDIRDDDNDNSYQPDDTYDDEAFNNDDDDIIALICGLHMCLHNRCWRRMTTLEPNDKSTLCDRLGPFVLRSFASADDKVIAGDGDDVIKCVVLLAIWDPLAVDNDNNILSDGGILTFWPSVLLVMTRHQLAATTNKAICYMQRYPSPSLCFYLALPAFTSMLSRSPIASSFGLSSQAMAVVICAPHWVPKSFPGTFPSPDSLNQWTLGPSFLNWFQLGVTICNTTEPFSPCFPAKWCCRVLHILLWNHCPSSNS